jgi:hypothetical protein
MADIKTAAQLKREIAYFVQRLRETRSVDRRRRCHVAIRKRERLLIEALRRESRGRG